MKDLVHKTFISSTFSDESLKLNDFLRDSVSATINVSDFYYIGLYKPFKDIYLEFVTADTNTPTATYEYHNGTTWVDLPNLKDDTQGFQRDGFIRWDFDDNSQITESWKEVAVDSDTLYWIRISFDVAVTFDLIGLYRS